MAMQNRVAPDGTIHATPERGSLFGNRGGCFHDDDGVLKRRHWSSRAWLCCVLDFKGRRRLLRQPGRYTELFFLDEATALAAGHRPCFECRRGEAMAFATSWARLRGRDDRAQVAEMDDTLQAERIGSDGGKRVHRTRIDALPDGAMVLRDGRTWLVGRDHLLPWSFGGYGRPIARPRRDMVGLLTPPAIVAILSAGYRPRLHPSAREPA